MIKFTGFIFAKGPRLSENADASFPRSFKSALLSSNPTFPAIYIDITFPCDFIGAISAKPSLKVKCPYKLLNLDVSKVTIFVITEPIVDEKKALFLIFSAIKKFSNLPNGPSCPSLTLKSR